MQNTARSSSGTADEPDVRVQVLGPCAVAVDDRTVDLTAVQRRLLARLALTAPRPVSADRLAGAVWGDAQPATGRASLANHISRIRATVGVCIIETTAEGYRLIAPTDIGEVVAVTRDAEKALGDGDAARAFALIDPTLDEWHGEPFTDLADLHDLEDVESTRRYLGEVRAHAEDLRVDAAVRSGRARWAAPEAERMVGLRPLDEHRWALLIRALDEGGRRGDALGAIDRARLTLRDHAGLDPGPDLRTLEASILGVDPATRTIGAKRLIGRQAEVSLLLDVARSGGTATVRGEVGAGKSSLLAEIHRQLRQEDGGERPAVAHARCLANRSAPVAVLTGLLEDLGEAADSVAGPVEGFIAAVERVTNRHPVALIVDDVTLAGPSSREALEGASRIDRVALITSEGSDRPDARPVLASGSDVQVELGPLSPSMVADLASDLTEPGTELSTALLDWLIEMSGGNPLILEYLFEAELGTETTEENGVAITSSDLTDGVPGGLSDLVRRRLGRLSAQTRSVVELAGVCGPTAPSQLLIDHGSDASLRAAHDDGLLLVDDHGMTHFRHGAVQRAVRAEVPTGRRTELHYTVGTALRDTGAPPSVVAHHLQQAAHLDPLAAIDAAQDAARDAAAQGAHREAAGWFEQAATVARSAGTTGTRPLIEALIGRGNSLRLAGDRTHEAILFEAADLATELGDPDLLGAAALAQLELGATTDTGQLHERAVELAVRALDVVTDPEQMAMIGAAASLAYSMSGQSDECRRLYVEAEQSARHEATRRKVLPYTYLGLGHPADLDRRERHTDELLELADAADDPVARFEGLQLAFSVAIQRGHGDRTRAVVDEMASLAERLGDVGRRWSAGYVRAAVAHLDDDLDHSEALAGGALELFSAVAPSRAFAAYGGQLLAIRMAQDRVVELADTMHDLLKKQPGVPAWHAAYALAMTTVDPAIARHHAAVALDDVPRDFTWMAAHLVGGRAAARTGDDVTTPIYLHRLRPFADLVCWQGTCSYGPVATVIAALELAAGDRRAATRHANTARALARSLNAPVFERDLDDVLARSGRDG